MDRHRMIGTLRAVETDDGSLKVEGEACPYGIIGYPRNGPRQGIAIDPGAFTATLERRTDSPDRDIILCICHDVARAVGRSNNPLDVGKLEFEDTATHLTYTATLDPEDPEAVSCYAKIKNRVFTAVSVGFGVVKSKAAKRPDTGPDGSGEEKKTVVATECELYELSVLAHGAYDTTAVAAEPASTEELVEIAKMLGASEVTVNESGAWVYTITETSTFDQERVYDEGGKTRVTTREVVETEVVSDYDESAEAEGGDDADLSAGEQTDSGDAADPPDGAEGETVEASPDADADAAEPADDEMTRAAATEAKLIARGLI